MLRTLGDTVAEWLEKWGCHGACSGLGALTVSPGQSQSLCLEPAGVRLAVGDMQRDAGLASALGGHGSLASNLSSWIAPELARSTHCWGPELLSQNSGSWGSGICV